MPHRPVWWCKIHEIKFWWRWTWSRRVFNNYNILTQISPLSTRSGRSSKTWARSWTAYYPAELVAQESIKLYIEHILQVLWDENLLQDKMSEDRNKKLKILLLMIKAMLMMTKKTYYIKIKAKKIISWIQGNQIH